MQSVKFGTQTPREEKMHSQKSLSCRRYRTKNCLEWLVVNYLFQLIFIFPLFLGMVMYANKFKIKEKKINWNKKLTATYKYLSNDQKFFKKFKAEVHNFYCYFLCKSFPKLIQGIEDITWLHGDTKFLFEY